ncbi:uncharacterized protein LOC128204401 [Mya arenaria]|uniref:uncharacterized protein LOC128204401 n=1 Tax=Mya arenaria TaxID=6604 RepID=UPI0022E3B24C|nr:uncharacterized protein LOC128204401 [Mya arenaria]
MADEETRKRTMTDKGLEHYEETRSKFYKKVQTSYDRLCSTLEETNVDLENPEANKVLLDRLHSAHATYLTVSSEFADFLSRSITESSKAELEEFDKQVKLIGDRVSEAVQKINDIIGTSKAAVSIRSKSSHGSKESHVSSSSSSRARADTARIRLEYAKREAELMKKMALIEEERLLAVARASRVKQEVSADLNVLKVEGDVAVAEIEASYAEEADGVSRNADFDLTYEAASERSKNYIDNLPEIPRAGAAGTQSKPTVYASRDPDRHFECDNVSHNSERYLKENHCEEEQARVRVHQESVLRNSDADILTSFLLRKDIMPQRLKKFNEKPQSFGVWKTTFKSVMKELKVTPTEEIDLLVNNLGSESQIWAESIHSANASNPEHGLELIWERLDNCYGSPEKVEASLKLRIRKFPQLTNKDNKRLYELSDLLLEVFSVKKDPQFATQFAAYDSSSAVNEIVCKLPFNMQQKWISHAARYKKEHKVTFPPFSVFVEFVRDNSKIRNDPAFQWEHQVVEACPKPKQRQSSSINARVVNRKTDIHIGSEISDDKMKNDQITRCPIHRSGHGLKECKTFANMTWEERRKLLKEKGICYRCISSSDHASTNCPVSVTCEICMKKNHLTAMHRDRTEFNVRNSAVPASDQSKVTVSSKCTSLCGQGFRGRSCGKIVLVDVAYKGHENTERVYAILDDQSNRSLISPELCNKLNVSGESTEYTLSSCSGSSVMAGRRVSGLTVSSKGAPRGSRFGFELPTLIECDAIPQDTSEIPTPEVARSFAHLKKIASFMPPLEPDCGIELLIGRDLLEVHHVIDQIIGPKDTPFALRLPLGWVIVGEVCLGRVHQPDSVNTYFTSICKDGRETIFRPCPSYLTVKEPDFSDDVVFRRQPDDNKVGLSAEDRSFLRIMNSEFAMDKSGQWTAPLPFKSPRPMLPDNKEQVFKRAVSLKKSLEQNPEKCQQLVQFMQKIFDNGAAEKAPTRDEDGKENWYLPLFGVYHPKKPDQIRGVFDSSVAFRGQSLNDLLLSGPNLTNNLLGVLLRFRRDKYAVSADIEQMFYRFLVNNEHRDFLRFFWFQNNNPELPFTVFRMKVHVFGNKPSPAVATYGLRKAVESVDKDIQQFVAKDFYVDDALTSKPTREQAVSLLQRTRKALRV